MNDKDVVHENALLIHLITEVFFHISEADDGYRQQHDGEIYHSSSISGNNDARGVLRYLFIFACVEILLLPQTVWLSVGQGNSWQSDF